MIDTDEIADLVLAIHKTFDAQMPTPSVGAVNYALAWMLGQSLSQSSDPRGALFTAMVRATKSMQEHLKRDEAEAEAEAEAEIRVPTFVKRKR